MAPDFLYEPPRPERTVAIRMGRGANPLERSTLEHLVYGGLPVHARHFREVKERVASGELVEKRQTLITEIKRDPALFIFCLRELRALGVRHEHPQNPVSTLLSLDRETLMGLFTVNTENISRHHLAQAGPIQASALQHLLLGLAAAESLGSCVGMEPDLVYTATVFYELGDVLLAWNYPEVYIRILSTHRRYGDAVDAEWTRLIGTTPRKIGFALADEWNLPTDLRFAFHQRAQGSSLIEFTQGKEPALHELCEAADLYAQVHDPAHYPEGSATWLLERDKLTEIFGPHIIQTFDQRAREWLSPFLDEIPALRKLSFAKSLLKDSTTNQEAAETSQLPNTYVTHCNKELVPLFEEVYQHIENHKIRVDALQILVDKVFPATGFVRGCLFLLDRHTDMLNPALRFGDVPLSRYQSHPAREDNDFGISLESHIPYRSTLNGVTGETIETIMGRLENRVHPGVLYLELSAELAADPHKDPLTIFHALRATLDDCLGVRPDARSILKANSRV